MESRSSDRKLNSLPPEPFRHQDSAIAPHRSASPARSSIARPRNGRGLPPRLSRNAFTPVRAPRRRVDLLEDERKRGYIDEAMFQLGREIQETHERGSRIGGSTWSTMPSGDRIERRRAAAARTYEVGAEIVMMETAMSEAIGWAGFQFVRAILTAEHTFGSWAAAPLAPAQEGADLAT